MLPDTPSHQFAPIMDYPEVMPSADLSRGYDPHKLKQYDWAVGGYNEQRRGMYTAPQYKNERNIHMGIDIWAKAGQSVYAFWNGEVAYLQDNDEVGNYGGTIVTRHFFGEGSLFALYGHLSKASLEMVHEGEEIKKGHKLGELGTHSENGGWVPHLHFQLSCQDPKEADMPGVVAPENRADALQIYPDPRSVLGKLY